jgi:hypothetical protein
MRLLLLVKLEGLAMLVGLAMLAAGEMWSRLLAGLTGCAPRKRRSPGRRRLSPDVGAGDRGAGLGGEAAAPRLGEPRYAPNAGDDGRGVGSWVNSAAGCASEASMGEALASSGSRCSVAAAALGRAAPGAGLGGPGTGGEELDTGSVTGCAGCWGAASAGPEAGAARRPWGGWAACCLGATAGEAGLRRSKGRSAARW